MKTHQHRAEAELENMWLMDESQRQRQGEPVLEGEPRSESEARMVRNRDNRRECQRARASAEAEARRGEEGERPGWQEGRII